LAEWKRLKRVSASDTLGNTYLDSLRFNTKGAFRVQQLTDQGALTIYGWRSFHGTGYRLLINTTIGTALSILELDRIRETLRSLRPLDTPMTTPTRFGESLPDGT